MTFWQTLPKPIFCLAPMADVTDPAFRYIIAKYGKPDVMWTEFVSADGLFKGGYDALIGDLDFTPTERPIVAQFFSREPELMKQAAKLALQLGFDGVDINMGCPDANVCKQGAGAAIIKDPKRAQELIIASKEGAGELPVSVKTRIGYTQNEIETWLPALLEVKPAVITLHARTKKEMSAVPAHWEVISRAVQIRNEMQHNFLPEDRTLLFGNGDVTDLSDARKKVEEYGCDGVMLGRAIFGNPWLFAHRERPELRERLQVLKEHVEYFAQTVGRKKPFAIMKKHFKSYMKGEGSDKQLLVELMATTNALEACAILEAEIKAIS